MNGRRPRRSAFTLQAMCGNAVGMVAFVLAYLAVADLVAAVAAALLAGGVGYVGAGRLVDAYDL